MIAQRKCDACSRYYSPKYGRGDYCAECAGASPRERLQRRQDAAAEVDPSRRRFLAARKLD